MSNVTPVYSDWSKSSFPADGVQGVVPVGNSRKPVKSLDLDRVLPFTVLRTKFSVNPRQVEHRRVKKRMLSEQPLGRKAETFVSRFGYQNHSGYYV
jgi:hypothetical protein